MNRQQKAALVEELAAQIRAAEAVLAVDYRGISVRQAAQLRERLGEAGATFRIVKNTLTRRAANQDGEPLSAEQMESLSRLPARDLMQAQLVGAMASPVTGVVRGLNQLIAGLALQLRQVADDGLVGEEPKANDGPEGTAAQPEAGGEED
jgi:large subunit ribosomal protein L10